MKPLELYDGLTRLAVEHDPDGRTRITVDDRNHEGFTYTTASPAVRAVIAAFLTEGVR